MTSPSVRSVPPAPVALVAGASRGLGLQVCRELLARGWTVHGLARDAAALDRAHAAVPAADAHRFHTRSVDVRTADAVADAVDRVLAQEGAVDAAFHVAGVIEVGALEGVTLGHVRDAVDTMLMGPVHLCLALLPSMRARGHGRIGIVSSVGGLVPVPRLVPYSVAKFGAVGLAEGLAAELSGTGVTVSSVTPWLMRTGGHEHAWFTGDRRVDHSWFTAAASLPGLSLPVERAARRIVDGVLAGRPVVRTTPWVSLVARVHGLAPATTVRAVGLAARLLPGSAPARRWQRRDRPGTPGAVVDRDHPSRVLDAVAVLGRRAAHRQNEYPVAVPQGRP